MVAVPYCYHPGLYVMHLFFLNEVGGGLKTTEIKIYPESSKNRGEHQLLLSAPPV